MESLYVINVKNKEYIDFINDVLRMVTIQWMIQFLFYINNPSDVVFFSADFFLLLIYIILGVCVYWLIIKKLVVFK